MKKKKSFKRGRSVEHIGKAVERRKIFEMDLSKFVIIWAIILLVLIIFSLVIYLSASIPILEKILAFLPKLLFAPPGASTGFSGSGETELIIYDSTDLGENRFSGISTDFFANYTEVGIGSIDDANGNCEVIYDLSGAGGPVISSVGMTYNAVSLLWEKSSAFNYKGIHSFEVSCSTTLVSVADGDVTLSNPFVISNSEPDLSETPGGIVDIDGNPLNNDILNCIEDEICIYNITTNVSDPDVNEALFFDFVAGPNSTLTNFTINSAAGILEVNITNDGETGSKKLELDVSDSDGARDTGILMTNIATVNDPPFFVNLINQSFNRSFQFDYTIYATDEEKNVPYSYSIEFLSCVLAPWSTRIDCNLLTPADYTTDDGVVNGSFGFINISFTPTRNDVGIYLINFTLSDSGIAGSAMRSELVEFEVANLNEAPFFFNVCDGKRDGVEDTEFTCYVNATDIDELSSLTFKSNQSWFIDNVAVPTGLFSNFNASVFVNFTANDSIVGNWSVIVDVTDTGSPVLSNTTQFYLYIDNVNDIVALEDIPDLNAYTSNIYAIMVNATDNDLLIPDKTVYNEILNFTSDTAWVSINPVGVVAGTNITRALIQFNGADAPVGLSVVTIRVTDASGFFAEKTFVINVSINNPPVWDSNAVTQYVLTEDGLTSIDLSDNVTDADGDILTFDYLSDTVFPSFLIGASGSSAGVVSFIPTDEDVGVHYVTINASDGIFFSAGLTFNFTVYNANDQPFIVNGDVVGNNVTINPVTLNMNVFEDDVAEIFVFVNDDDLRVPSVQSGFFEEQISATTLILGPNANLFSFSEDVLFPPNEQLFITGFIPGKADVGFYEVFVNFSDNAGSSVFRQFNLTISEINHAPVLTNIGDKTAVINSQFSYDINATDLEDGIDLDGNLVFSLSFLPDGNTNNFVNGNESIFNTTSGLLDVFFVSADAGLYHINITVNDTGGLQSSADFWLNVNNFPSIISPDVNTVFNLIEGVQSNLTFFVNSTTIGNLSYEFFIGNESRFKISFNDSTYTWGFIPGFNDETYGEYGNLSLIVSIAEFDFANDTRTWRINVTHANAPVQFIKTIGDKEGNFGSPILINLTEHFRDFDSGDNRYNQSVNFSAKSDANVSRISYIVSSGWILSFSASESVVEILNITASDLNAFGARITNITSNNFEIKFTEPVQVPTPQPVPSPDSGGGSSSRTGRPVPLKIIVPNPVSAKKGEIIELPIEIVNEGDTGLKNIDLSTLLAINGISSEDALISFDRNLIENLPKGARESVLLTIVLPEDKLGLFEITIEADAADPKFTDTSKVYISVQEGETIAERILFTEEFIADNPECVELKEILNEADALSRSGEKESAEKKVQEALDACKEVISQRSLFSTARLKEKLQDKVFVYLLIVTILALVFGIAYYVYRRIQFQKSMEDSMREDFKSF